jgi:hypothetical protein
MRSSKLGHSRQAWPTASPLKESRIVDQDHMTAHGVRPDQLKFPQQGTLSQTLCETLNVVRIEPEKTPF